MQKAVVVWIAVIVGSMVGCSCHHVQHCEVGPCDTGTGQACSATMPCPSGQSCLAGVCITGGPCSDTMACPSGEYCAGGFCTADCSASMPCSGGATCSANGQCVGGACALMPPLNGCGNPCSASMSCPAGLYCGPMGTCTADCAPSRGLSCPGSEMCSADGHCVGGGMDAGVCSGTGAPMGCGHVCTPSLACPMGTYCYLGHCTADCSSTIACASPLTCSIDGHCTSGGGGDGGVGTQCIDPSSGRYDNPYLQDCGHTGTCIDVSSDPDNCGACGHPCLASQRCQNGMCFSSCGPPTTDCNRHCVNLRQDSANCGMCGNRCPRHDPSDPMALDEFCLNGTCGCAGPARGQWQCGTMCVNEDSDRMNCGSCGNECLTTCPTHPDTCAAQGFECGAAGDGCGGPLDCGGCPLPGDTCGGGGDPSHCGHVVYPDGGIGHPCTPRTSCPAGYCGPYPDGCGGSIDCPTVCTLPDTCGGAGRAHLHECGHPVCNHMGCVDNCALAGLSNCHDRCVDLSQSPSDCGRCDNPVGQGTCSGGSIQCNAPAPAGTDGGSGSCPAGGCLICPGVGCVNAQSDTHHCGNCTTVCPMGIGHACVMGHCT